MDPDAGIEMDSSQRAVVEAVNASLNVFFTGVAGTGASQLHANRLHPTPGPTSAIEGDELYTLPLHARGSV